MIAADARFVIPASMLVEAPQTGRPACPLKSLPSAKSVQLQRIRQGAAAQRERSVWRTAGIAVAAAGVPCVLAASLRRRGHARRHRRPAARTCRRSAGAQQLLEQCARQDDCVAEQDPIANTRLGGIVEQLYASFNSCDADATAECFTEDVVYEDLLLGASTIVESREDFRELIQTHPVFVARRVCRAMQLRPMAIAVRVDSLAEDPAKGTVGVEWHVEVDGEPLSLGRGLSFMKICKRTGLIKRAVDLVEAPWRVVGLLLAPFARGLRELFRLTAIGWLTCYLLILTFAFVFIYRPAMHGLRTSIDAISDFRDSLGSASAEHVIQLLLEQLTGS
eukprot:TRINITY_DN123631_c0_g1_i1.p1 TRINITY_DN123631_c0_g1~~TRINITY_DN123631_c0_g1_i1.p1  ORF type:complete len:335 (-),score=53.50 TRINITY_DN123631_c0_g1_i1:279-1283(-)